jgi:mannitol-specific phosphotransferase system IIBC component
MSGTARWLLILATILTLSIAYYFLIALPKANEQRLAFEKQKYQEQKAKEEAKEQAEKEAKASNDMLLAACLQDAQTSRLEFLRLNGTVQKKMVLSGRLSRLRKRLNNA